mgnify:CR=1 FL=1
MKWIVDIEAEEARGVVDTAWHSPLEMEQERERIAKELGIPVSRLEFRDPPNFQPPTA